MKIPSHERAIFLVVPRTESIADAFRRLLTHEEVRAYDLPAPWDITWGSIDVLRDVPSISTIDLAALDELFAYFARAGTSDALDAFVTRSWSEIPDRVREYWLGRGAFSIMAGLFRMGPKAKDVAPPPGFRTDRRAFARFEATYRLHALPGSHADPIAPSDEGSLVVYPFDVRNVTARAEAGLSSDAGESIVEIFAYEAGRDRHRRVAEAVAASLGGRVLDPDGR